MTQCSRTHPRFLYVSARQTSEFKNFTNAHPSTEDADRRLNFAFFGKVIHRFRHISRSRRGGCCCYYPSIHFQACLPCLLSGQNIFLARALGRKGGEGGGKSSHLPWSAQTGNGGAKRRLRVTESFFEGGVRGKPKNVLFLSETVRRWVAGCVLASFRRFWLAFFIYHL